LYPQRVSVPSPADGRYDQLGQEFRAYDPASALALIIVAVDVATMMRSARH